MNIKNFGKPADKMKSVDITPELDSIVKDVAADVESKAGKPAAEAITNLLKSKEDAVNQLVNQEMKAYFERIYQKLSGSLTFKAYSIVASRPFGMVSLIVALLTALTLFIRRRDLTSFMFSMGIADLIILGGFFAERLAITQLFMKVTEELLGVGVVPSGIMDKDLITVAVMTAGVFIGALIARIVRV